MMFWHNIKHTESMSTVANENTFHKDNMPQWGPFLMPNTETLSQSINIVK